MKRKGERFLAKGTTLQIERHIQDEGSWHEGLYQGSNHVNEEERP